MVSLDIEKTAKRERAAATHISVSSLARRWAVSPAHAYRLIEQGVLPHMRLGTAIRVPIDAVERFEREAAVPELAAR